MSKDMIEEYMRPQVSQLAVIECCRYVVSLRGVKHGALKDRGIGASGRKIVYPAFVRKNVDLTCSAYIIEMGHFDTKSPLKYINSKE